MLSLSTLAAATSHDGRRLFVGRKDIKYFYSFTIFQLFFLKQKKDKLDYTRIAKPLRRKDFNSFVLILLSAFYKTA